MIIPCAVYAFLNIGRSGVIWVLVCRFLLGCILLFYPSKTAAYYPLPRVFNPFFGLLLCYAWELRKISLGTLYFCGSNLSVNPK